MLLCSVALLALFASAQGRAVNISNTWVLPEEGFPVFYRYFRDRISWYEADAVCQFHHANLVTVDTTAQYDAVRAYLKELDISSAVWVGLIRSNPDGEFTWTDYRGLSGEGYWSSAPDTRTSPLCAAADPASDYRWEARACGGPTVASFICELPVPQWALGNEGCMIRSLPALTVLYLPETAAVQLTADCGLAGVKRLQCTGNVKRENLLRDLSCADEEELTTLPSLTPQNYTWVSTTDTTFIDQETTPTATSEENSTTEHNDGSNETSTVLTSSSINIVMDQKITTMFTHINKFNRINNNVLENNVGLNLIHNNNLHSNDIPKIANSDKYWPSEEQDKIEDEKYMQHKMLHEEIARLGNVENIFTQPTDHFVPPLVMAKAKLSDDMTVLSLQEKHAQHLAQQSLSKPNNQHPQNDKKHETDVAKPTTAAPTAVTMDKILFVHETNSNKKDKIKVSMPKKYSEKVYEKKIKVQKIIDLRPYSIDKSAEPTSSTTVKPTTTQIEIKSSPLVGTLSDDEDVSLNLTIFLNDKSETHEEKAFYNYSNDISKLEIVKNSTSNNSIEIRLLDVEATEQSKHEILKEDFEIKTPNVTLNTTVLNITIITETSPTIIPTVFETTTQPLLSITNTSTPQLPQTTTTHEADVSESKDKTTDSPFYTETSQSTSIQSSITPVLPNKILSTTKTESNILSKSTKDITVITLDDKIITTEDNNITKIIITSSPDTFLDDIANTEADEKFATNSSSSETLDDLNSPLLSGANEPIRRPNRSRRPQPPPNRNKFNPFRILG